MGRPTSNPRPRPTPEELLAAVGTTMPDVIAPGLKVLFCGINPSVYSAVVRHHFARPGNRFWPALHASGFTPRLFSPFEQDALLALGCGITNVVAQASVSADTLTAAEYAEGGRQLEARVRRYHPRFLAVLGIGAWRTAFQKPRAVLGPQPESLGGARVWVLPNPSGLNAHYRPVDLARLFRVFREAVAADGA
ncbi:G/U mismatch-specific DNA glycosylase [Melittangium boletus]|uniref:G/U mismatch-specific DNA glycosylase n=1 Tax=Melittangium boletus TaxID=83453 RepID=UPI003DA4C6DC